MNPFENEKISNPFENLNNNKIFEEPENIILWKETLKRKKITFILGWNLPIEELKNHLKFIKKKNGCNGTIVSKKKTIINKNINDDTKSNSESESENISENKISIDNLNSSITIQLQGDHIDFMKNYLIESGINKSNIIIKG